MTRKDPFSLPDEQVDARKGSIAAGSAPLVSAYVDQPIAQRQRDEDLAALVADMIAADGEPSPAD